MSTFSSRSLRQAPIDTLQTNVCGDRAKGYVAETRSIPDQKVVAMQVMISLEKDFPALVVQVPIQ